MALGRWNGKSGQGLGRGPGQTAWVCILALHLIAVWSLASYITFSFLVCRRELKIQFHLRVVEINNNTYEVLEPYL